MTQSDRGVVPICTEPPSILTSLVTVFQSAPAVPTLVTTRGIDARNLAEFIFGKLCAGVSVDFLGLPLWFQKQPALPGLEMTGRRDRYQRAMSSAFC